MGAWIKLKASDGFELSAWRAEPSGAPRGGLVVVQEIFGVNAHIRSVADGFAADGYLAIAPAIFDRVEPRLRRRLRARADGARQRAGAASSSREVTLLDVAAAIAAADGGRQGRRRRLLPGRHGRLGRRGAKSTGVSAAVGYYGGGVPRPRRPASRAFRPCCISARRTRTFRSTACAPSPRRTRTRRSSPIRPAATPSIVTAMRLRRAERDAGAPAHDGVLRLEARRA